MMMYTNKTPRMQVLNLRSGGSLHVPPHSRVDLPEGDEHSDDVKVQVRQKRAALLPARMAAPVLEAPKAKVSAVVDEKKPATLSQK